MLKMEHHDSDGLKTESHVECNRIIGVNECVGAFIIYVSVISSDKRCVKASMIVDNRHHCSHIG